MQSQVVLATILLALCLLASARDLKIKLPARRALLGQLPPATQPCFYDPTMAFAKFPGVCTINPAWLAAQTPHSSGAKADVYQAKWDIACRKHFVNMPSEPVLAAIVNGTALPPDMLKALKSCNDDSSHYCQVTFITQDASAMSCTAQKDAGLTKYGGLCPGAPFTNFLMCQLKRRSECGGTCEWDTRGAYSYYTGYPTGIHTVQEFMAATNDTVLQRSFCYPKAAADWSNASAIYEYKANVTGFKGSCKYAQGELLRQANEEMCTSFNDPGGYLGLMQGYVNLTFYGGAVSYDYDFSGIDSRAADGCLSMGCRIYEVPYTRDVTSWYMTPWVLDLRFVCGPEAWKQAAMGYYDRSRDIALLRALHQCSAPELLYDQAACDSTVLVPY